MKFFNLYVVIFVGVAFVFASGAQGEKTTLFEEKVRARPEASPVQLESNAPKPAVKIKPRIDRKLEKEFSINLQNGIDAFQEEDFEASLTLLEKALHMIGSLPHRSGNAKNINKLLAQTARKLEDYEKLIRFQTRVVKLVLAEGDNGDSDELALERFNLGRYHASAKDNAAAAEYLIKALAHYKEYEYDGKSAATYRELGKVY